MKKLFFLMSSFLLVNTAFCGQYLGLHLGPDHSHVTIQNVKGLKTGYKIGANYGYEFGNGFRVEGEFAYRHNAYKTKYTLEGENESSKSRHLHAYSYMINGFYDIASLGYAGLTPYIGVGIGYCETSDKSKFKSQDKTDVDIERDARFAYQAIFGAKYPLNDAFYVASEYKYFCGREHTKDHSIELILGRKF